MRIETLEHRGEMEPAFLHLSFSQCDACVQEPFRSIAAARLVNEESTLLSYMRSSKPHKEARMTVVSSEEPSRGSGPQMMAVMWISLFISNTHRLYISPSHTLLLNSTWDGRETHFARPCQAVLQPCEGLFRNKACIMDTWQLLSVMARHPLWAQLMQHLHRQDQHSSHCPTSPSASSPVFLALPLCS